MKTRAGGAAQRHVALLRGINVGGKHSLPMKQLAGFFEAVGCTGVTTYIQSGNVIFSADVELARRVPALVASAIRAELGFDAPLVTRTAAQLRALYLANPFAADADPKALHVAFLADRPTSQRVATLDPERSPPDRFALCGREIYLWCPNGVARTKLTTAYFDSALATTSTLRNWRTVGSLVELVESA